MNKQDKSITSKAIGVDLGTHTTVMARFEDNKINIIPTDTFDRSLPTIVALAQKPLSNERMIGLSA